MITFGGYLWLTAGGNPSRTGKAKDRRKQCERNVNFKQPKAVSFRDLVDAMNVEA